MMKNFEEILAANPTFENLTAEHIATLKECARDTHFEAGQIIFSTGGEADHFYLLREGTVALQVHSPNRGPITILRISEGQVLGGSWLVPPYQWYFDAQAMAPVQAIAFDARCVRGKCEVNHELGYQLMKQFFQIMMDRLIATRLQLLDLYGGEEIIEKGP